MLYYCEYPTIRKKFDAIVVITFKNVEEKGMREVIVRELVDAVKEVAGEGYEVCHNLAKKNNGVEFQAIIVRMLGDVASSLVYVDKYLDDIENGYMTIAEVAKAVFRIYENNKNPNLEIDISKLMNKQYILDHVEYQIVNSERNAEKLHGVPSRKIVDLAALYRTVVSDDDNGTVSYVVSNETIVIAGISIEELDEAAARNTEKIGFVVQSMAEEMAEMIGMSEAEEMAEAMSGGYQMFVLSNTRKSNGANIILYGKELAALAERIDDDFFILPSSIHELIAIPASQVEADALKQMVRDVNDVAVSEEEVLGYEVYRYCRETGKVMIAV